MPVHLDLEVLLAPCTCRNGGVRIAASVYPPPDSLTPKIGPVDKQILKESKEDLKHTAEYFLVSEQLNGISIAET